MHALVLETYDYNIWTFEAYKKQFPEKKKLYITYSSVSIMVVQGNNLVETFLKLLQTQSVISGNYVASSKISCVVCIWRGL